MLSYSERLEIGFLMLSDAAEEVIEEDVLDLRDEEAVAEEYDDLDDLLSK